MNFIACFAAAKKIAQVVAAAAGRTAVTLSPTVTIYFVDKADPRLLAHEAKHRQQAARFLPWWARGKANPLAIVGNQVAAVRWLNEYYKFHKLYGYEFNPFEVEARNAENPS